jgi:hypothetical protein
MCNEHVIPSSVVDHLFECPIYAEQMGLLYVSEVAS